jgi:hypothetical protein
MKLAVTDANIFIDLIKLQMLALLFNIDMEIHTTGEIVDQLNDQQLVHLTEFIVNLLLSFRANGFFKAPTQNVLAAYL